jgi:hypothetical protein
MGYARFALPLQSMLWHCIGMTQKPVPQTKDKKRLKDWQTHKTQTNTHNVSLCLCKDTYTHTHTCTLQAMILSSLSHTQGGYLVIHTCAELVLHTLRNLELIVIFYIHKVAS